MRQDKCDKVSELQKKVFQYKGKAGEALEQNDMSLFEFYSSFITMYKAKIKTILQRRDHGNSQI